MKDFEFEFKPGKLGIASTITIILGLLKVSGALNCGWLVVFFPLMFVIGYYIISIFLLGFFIVLYISFDTSEEKNENNETWQERLDEKMEENEESDS